jgi:hypothetical protein
MTPGGGPDGNFYLERYCSDCEDKVPMDIDIEPEEVQEEMEKTQRETQLEHGAPIPYAKSGRGPPGSLILHFYEEQEHYNPFLDTHYVSDRWMLVSREECSEFSTDGCVELYVLFNEHPHMKMVAKFGGKWRGEAIDKILSNIAENGQIGQSRCFDSKL